MNITVMEAKKVTKKIAKFKTASRVPAWIFASSTCPVCLWGILESCNRSDEIYSDQVIVAETDDERYVFHPNCFGRAKVERWI